MRQSLTIISLFSAAISFGQVGDTIYMDSLHHEVTSNLHAKYLRIITGYDQKTDRFTAIEYDSKGKRFFFGQLRFTNSTLPDGKYEYYHENGSIRVKGICKNTFNKDFEFEEEYWHPNGVLQGNASFKKQNILHNYFDSLGRQEITEGNGNCAFFDYVEKLVHHGLIVDGKKSGVWTSYDFNKNIEAREHYREGRLVKGFKFRNETDSVKYKYFGIVEDVAATNRIERQVKKEIKTQIANRLNQKIEICYTIYIKSGRIADVQLLRDSFINKYKIKLGRINVTKELQVNIQGEPIDEIVLPFCFKIRV